MFITENETIGLRQYVHEDDHDWYLCWQDIDTQKGYNGIFDESFDAFCASLHIDRFKFWVTVIDKCTNTSVGVLRLGLDENCPDLAIWIYPQYRNKGYGAASFRLALEYIFANYDYDTISAGCFWDNTYSRKILEKTGFSRYPEFDEVETHYLTGKETVMQEYRINKADFRHTIIPRN